MAHVEAGHVTSIDRFEQEADAMRVELARCVAQIVDQGLERALVAHGWSDARQAVEHRAIETTRILDALAHTLAKLILPIRMASEASFAGGPVPGRQVEQYLRQAVLG